MFMELDHGAILRKETGPNAPRIIRFALGNPLTMKEMVKHVPEAGSYAPVTILVDERPDGVHLTYDKMASLLPPCGKPRGSRGGSRSGLESREPSSSVGGVMIASPDSAVQGNGRSPSVRRSTTSVSSSRRGASPRKATIPESNPRII
jgi:Domain of unknown function DUF302